MIAYEKFTAWRAAHELALAVYSTSDQWPSSERYQLTAQVRRAVLSIPTTSQMVPPNGAAGSSDDLDIANGSLAELSYLLQFSRDRGIVDQKTFEVLASQRDQVGKLTYSLYASLGQRRTPPDRLTA
jgi:four helix bundle protein